MEEIKSKMTNAVAKEFGSKCTNWKKSNRRTRWGEGKSMDINWIKSLINMKENEEYENINEKRQHRMKDKMVNKAWRNYKWRKIKEWIT